MRVRGKSYKGGGNGERSKALEGRLLTVSIMCVYVNV